MTDSNDQFGRLEERLLKVIEIFRRTQSEKRSLEQQVERLKEESKERVQAINAMERELIALRRDREEVRSRVEKLLARLDAATSSDQENRG